MFSRTFAPDTGGAPSAANDVRTELIALQADVRGLAESVQRLVVESPELAKASVEDAIRREPLRGVLMAAGAGFVMALLLRR
jgi:ElaB/YqjD/DUF883 family membrane-anchored ribosome-binding protein